jgi:hypothetical protein
LKVPPPEPAEKRRRWGKRLLVASSALLAWAAVIFATGGFLLDLGPVRVSSRNASRVLVLALALAVIAWHLAYREWVARRVRQIPSVLRRIDELIRSSAPAFERMAGPAAAVVAAVLLAVAIRYGSRVAGGADAFGYLSESVLWMHGMLGIDQAFAASLPWPNALGSFVPLAYRLGPNGVMGPTVAPGLPLVMALARLFSACGPYLVVPVCGAVLVAATFDLGRRIFSTPAALIACALVACSPVVVFESLVVMADVPAGAMWMCALAASARATPRSALAAGIFAGAGVLIRPNLLPLALFPWLLSVVRESRTGSMALRTGLFAAGSVPAALLIAWVNHRLYGSALSSGYGDLGGVFALKHAAANLRLYPGWWLESHGAIAFLFLAAFVRRRSYTPERLALAGYAVCVFVLYAFYLPFDQWWYLRFLIPAVPIAFLLTADVIVEATRRSPSLRVATLVAFAAVAGGHSIRFIDSKEILNNSIAEKRRYLDAAVHIDRAVPPEAVILAMQHSGSVRYYTGRLTMRWDVLDPASLDRAVDTLRTRGVAAYALLESWEEADFRGRFAGQRSLGMLTAGAASMSEDGELRLYPLSEAKAPGPAAVIPRATNDRCVDASPRFVEPEATRRLSQNLADRSTKTPGTSSAEPSVSTSAH